MVGVNQPGSPESDPHQGVVHGDVFMTDRPLMMIVEDDRDTAEMLAAYFSAGLRRDAGRLGHRCGARQEGPTPDLILLDIRRLIPTLKL
jgi:hypothetical protein